MTQSQGTIEASSTSRVERWLPGVQTLRTYQRSWLPRDVVEGIVLTALLVPAGMGYAEASGLPAIYGLYATVVPLVMYAIVGPRAIIVPPRAICWGSCWVIPNRKCLDLNRSGSSSVGFPWRLRRLSQ